MLFMPLIVSHSDLLSDDSNPGEGWLFLYPRMCDEVAEVLGGTIYVRYLVVDLYEHVGYAVYGKDGHQVFNSAYLLSAVIQRGGVSGNVLG